MSKDCKVINLKKRKNLDKPEFIIKYRILIPNRYQN